MDINDPIEQEYNAQRLKRAHGKIQTARRAMYLFAGLYVVYACRIFFLDNFPDPDSSLVLAMRISAAGIYALLALLSYRKAFLSLVFATLLTIIIFLANIAVGSGLREQVTFLVAAITIFILATALTPALNYDQLKETLKMK